MPIHDAKIRELFEEGRPIVEIAARTGTYSTYVGKRLLKMGLTPPTTKRGSPEELERRKAAQKAAWAHRKNSKK